MRHLFAAAAWLLLGAVCLQAQQSRPGEYELKATYLQHFGRFVSISDELAAAKGDSFRICVIGQDPFDKVLDSILSGETIMGRKVVHTRVSKLEEIRNCRILFVSSSEESRLQTVLQVIDKTGVLTVSDIPDFSRRGGMIEFVLDRNKIRFTVDLKPMEQAGLSVSSELLKVALIVRGTLPVRD